MFLALVTAYFSSVISSSKRLLFWKFCLSTQAFKHTAGKSSCATHGRHYGVKYVPSLSLMFILQKFTSVSDIFWKLWPWRDATTRIRRSWRVSTAAGFLWPGDNWTEWDHFDLRQIANTPWWWCKGSMCCQSHHNISALMYLLSLSDNHTSCFHNSPIK